MRYLLPFYRLISQPTRSEAPKLPPAEQVDVELDLRSPYVPCEIVEGFECEYGRVIEPQTLGSPVREERTVCDPE